MAEILDTGSIYQKPHDCEDELPGQAEWDGNRSGVNPGTVVRCSCDRLWVASPYNNTLVWFRRAYIKERWKYRKHGKVRP